MSVHEQRAAAVAQTMDAIRKIEAAKGVTRDALDAIKGTLIALAARTELFPPAHFPVATGRSGMVYRLSEDADLRFALYASAGVPGKAQPPHNHTTWAAISGVYGDEHNKRTLGQRHFELGLRTRGVVEVGHRHARQRRRLPARRFPYDRGAG